jgi:hypothetical protein
MHRMYIASIKLYNQKQNIMKKTILAASLAILIVFGCTNKDTPAPITGCMDATAVNFNAAANTSCTSCCTYQGGVLFYLTNPAVIGECGPVTVTLSTGQSSTIVQAYQGVPATCENLVGGYFLLNTGSYSYTITSPGCPLATGTATILPGCNRIPL